MAAGTAVSLSGACALLALDAARAIREGSLGVEDYVRALLARIDTLEPEVRAWVWIDRAHALERARAIDDAHRRGARHEALSGVPVGVKDVIDVAGMPTEDGTVLHAGRVATRDAALIARMRASGAWPVGKTVTTELATYAPGRTRNPHDPAHTPGGSSSGSAAAVACGMVPLAIGTQTNGSVIRPASFCGVVGYKPAFGRIARSGVLEQSPSFDQIGVFARTVDDVQALAEAIAGRDAGDPATLAIDPDDVEKFAIAAADLAAPIDADGGDAPTAAPREARIAWTRTPWWDRVDAEARRAFERWVAGFGDRLDEIELPEGAADVVAAHRLAMEAEIAGSYEREYEQGRSRLSTSLQGQIERGRLVSAVDWRKALAQRRTMLASLVPLFERYDAIATPAALGTAPLFSEGTGDPLMCTLWTFCGLPAITLPLLRGAGGLPLGVQLAGAPGRGGEARLLKMARRLMPGT